MPPPNNNPYVGPRSFSYEQRERFFGREREARYEDVPPGDHTFRVQSRDSLGDWGATATVAVLVPSWFWEAIWFRALALVALSAGVLALGQRRASKARAAREVEIFLGAPGHEGGHVLISDVEGNETERLFSGDEIGVPVHFCEHFGNSLPRSFRCRARHRYAAVGAVDDIDAEFAECRRVGQARMALFHRDREDSDLAFVFHRDRRISPGRIDRAGEQRGDGLAGALVRLIEGFDPGNLVETDLGEVVRGALSRA